MSPIGERLIVSCAIIFALIILVGGTWLAVVTLQPEWLNRAGALIVCTESALVVVEFHRRGRLHELEEEFSNNQYLRFEARRAEKQVVLVAVIIAILGEFLHGFGDLIVTFILSVVQH